MEGQFLFKTIEFQDINYQLFAVRDKDAIFDGWCEAANYFDASVRFQFNFVNSSTNKETYRERIVVPLRGDGTTACASSATQCSKTSLSAATTASSRASTSPSASRPRELQDRKATA